MELKDQILQTKERKKGFLKAMPEDTRTQIDTYTKLGKISKNYWAIIVCGAILAMITYRKPRRGSAGTAKAGRKELSAKIEGLLHEINKGGTTIHV